MIKIKNDILEDKIIVDGVEYPIGTLLVAKRADDEPWRISLSASGKAFVTVTDRKRLYKFGEIRFPDKINDEWVGFIDDAPTGYTIDSLFAGWRDYYSDSEANEIMNGGIRFNFCFEFEKAILPRHLIKLSGGAFGKRSDGKKNKPELFMSTK